MCVASEYFMKVGYAMDFFKTYFKRYSSKSYFKGLV